MKLLLTLTLMLSSVAFTQPASSGVIRAKDAIAAAHAIKGDAEKERAYVAINANSLQDGTDVVAVYEELDKLPVGVLTRPITPAGNIPSVKHLLDVLADARQPPHHAAVAALLEKENSKLTPKTASDYDRLSRRADRLYALTEAAGLGQNMQALPILRAMRNKGGQSGKYAEAAIARLGVDEDLDKMIEEIKKDPKSLVNLDGFGLKGYQRILKELNDSTLSEDEQNRVAGRFPRVVEREYLPDALALLKHQNPHIADIAANTIGSSVTSDDSDIIRGMLASPNSSIRNKGLLAIDRLWNPIYIEDVLKVLKHDNGWAQSMAAHMLGKHNVKESEAALIDVVNNPDSSDGVRKSAKYALGKMRN
mgnify:CR=1 FL=1